MSDLKMKIRKALAGSSSSSPVSTKTLTKLGKPDALALALEELLSTREINTAKVFKDGAWSVQCWLTGSIGLTPAFYIRPPGFALPTQVPQAAAKPPTAIVQPKTSIPPKKSFDLRNQTNLKKDTNMSNPNFIKKMSPIAQAIGDIIGEQPGIVRELLLEQALKRVPSSTKVQAFKASQNLNHASKKIRAETRSDGGRIFFLNDGKEAKPATWPAPTNEMLAKAKPVKAKKTEPAKPVGAGLKPARTSVEMDDGVLDPEFSLMLSESGNLHVSTHVVTIVLTPEQQARVHRFISRLNMIEQQARLHRLTTEA